MQGSRFVGHGPSPQGRAWRILLTVGQKLVRNLDEAMQKGVGLDLQRYDVMLHVSEGEGGRRMTELARAVVLSKSGLTALVDRMEADGLLERRPDPGDRRATRVVLTGEGESRFREASAHHREVVHRIFIDRVTEDEAVVMAGALERIRRELDGERGDENG
jgi:DNA-binding MarR family transcriptional regulator